MRKQLNKNIFFKILLGICIITPCLVLGAVHYPILAVYLVISALLILFCTSDKRGKRYIKLDIISYAFLGIICFTAFQIIPLPSFIVKIISPNTFELRQQAVAVLGLNTPAFMSLTLDVSLTSVELGKLLLYLSIYWSCICILKQNGSKIILLYVIVAGSIAALVLLTHKILMLQELYGFYSPMHVAIRTDRVSAPLINENHMAALLGLAAAATIGMALSTKEKSNKILLIATGALIGGSLLLTLSRGGIVAFIAGQLLFILLMVFKRIYSKSNHEHSIGQLTWLPLGLALSLGLGVFAAQDAIVGEFLDGNHGKIEMLTEGLPLALKFPVTGVGRGAFWVAFPLVSNWAAKTTFTHAENAIVQLIVDYGLFVGVGILLLFVFVIGKNLIVENQRTIVVASLSALFAFGLHNLVDFNMEIPGVAILAVALLAVVTETRSNGKKTAKNTRHVPDIIMYLLFATMIATAGFIGFYSFKYNIDNEEKKLKLALIKNNASQFSNNNIESFLTRHPADWYLPFVVGVYLYNTSNENPLPWFGQALKLNPSAAASHLYIGKTMLKKGHLNQAMIEFRVASRANTSFAPTIAKLLVAAKPQFAIIQKIAVDEKDKLLLWDQIAGEFARQNIDDETLVADIAILKLKTPSPRSLARHARRLAASGKTTEALNFAEILSKISKYKGAGAILKAEIYLKNNESEKEIEVLKKAIVQIPNHLDLYRKLAWACQRSKKKECTRDATAKLKILAKDVKQRSLVIELEGDLEKAYNNYRVSLVKYKQAYALYPSIRILQKTGQLALNLGDTVRAIEAYKKLESLEPTNHKWKKEIKRIEHTIRDKSVIHK